jgi:hypothetical protein
MLKCYLCNWDVINGNCTNRLHCGNKKEYNDGKPSRATTKEERDRAADSCRREEQNNGWADSPFGYYD